MLGVPSPIAGVTAVAASTPNRRKLARILHSMASSSVCTGWDGQHDLPKRKGPASGLEDRLLLGFDGPPSPVKNHQAHGGPTGNQPGYHGAGWAGPAMIGQQLSQKVS